jgi:hypothetical protein
MIRHLFRFFMLTYLILRQVQLGLPQSGVKVEDFADVPTLGSLEGHCVRRDMMHKIDIEDMNCGDTFYRSIITQVLSSWHLSLELDFINHSAILPISCCMACMVHLERNMTMVQYLRPCICSVSCRPFSQQHIGHYVQSQHRYLSPLSPLSE